ncbi:MAG: response regulator [Melioribacteraceae bacterium]|nr:response regulator [Melioribacteraceae bacterium]
MTEIKDKVLIVEDERDTLFILTKLLEKNGYEVASAINGSEALDIIDDFSPKVIVADWTMPIMDGIELCNRLKENEKHKLIYYIILTARTSLKDRVKGLDVGADDFLLKPTENQELLARIRSGVRIFNLQNELKEIEHEKALIEMATTIGHKINNPLSSLSVSLKSLEGDLDQIDKEKFVDDFELINEALARISSLANDLSHLKNPETEDYTSETKMLKLKK